MNYTIQMITITGFSAIIAFIVVRWLKNFLKKKHILDIPNQRSSHTVPTPRGGGIGILIAIFLSFGLFWLLRGELEHWEFFVSSIIIAVVGFVDDRKSLPVILRLSFQLGAAALIIYSTGGIEEFPLPSPVNFDLKFAGPVISLIWIISVMNFFNFLDGIDGYAGAQSLIAGVGIYFLGADPFVEAIGLAIAAASFGFLLHNWHPASIFMGDVGSSTLGFIFAVIPFYFERFSNADGVFYMSIFLWFFLADGAFTLIRRALKREKIWEAHRSHLYQRLVISGWSHSTVVLLIMIPASFLVFLAVIQTGDFYFNGWLIVLAGLFLFSILLLISYFREKKSKIQ